MFRVALLSSGVFGADFERNFEESERLCRTAADNMVHLVVLPEMFNSKDFLSGGKCFERFSLLARALDVAIAVPYLSFEMERLKNNLLVIDRHGALVIEYAQRFFTSRSGLYQAGDNFMVSELDTQVGRVKVGALFAEECRVPEPARALMIKGAEVVIVPNAVTAEAPSQLELNLIKMRAYENAMSVVGAHDVAYHPFGFLLPFTEASVGLRVAECDLANFRDYRSKTNFGDAFREVQYYKPLWENAISNAEMGRISAVASTAPLLFKLALLQMPAVVGDVNVNIATAERYCRQAAHAGAHLAVFPEMFNIGYPIPYNEGNSFARWFAVCAGDSVPDPVGVVAEMNRHLDEDHLVSYIDHFRELAKELDMAIAITYMSRGKEKPRNTVLVIDHQGNDVLKYSKIHLFAPFTIDALCEPGDEFSVGELDTPVGKVRLGALICADRNIPEPARVLMTQGAEVVIIPNACPLKGLDGILLDAVQTHAYVNGMAIAICNYPEPTKGRFEPAVDGYSAAFNPDGSCVRRVGVEEGVYFAEYNLEAIREYQSTPLAAALRVIPYYPELWSSPVADPFDGRLHALGARPERYSWRLRFFSDDTDTINVDDGKEETFSMAQF